MGGHARNNVASMCKLISTVHYRTATIFGV